MAIPFEREPVEHEERQERRAEIRRLYITKRDIRKYGMTPQCPGCTAVNRGGKAANHSEQCRDRIEKEIAEKEPEKFERAVERMAEAMEQGREAGGAESEETGEVDRRKKKT